MKKLSNFLTKLVPELPEVETIVRNLNKTIINYKIVDFWTEWEKAIKLDLNNFKKEIKGAIIKKIKRRGKNILVFLDNSQVILIHLKMTGHLLFKDKNQKKNKNFKERVNKYIRHIWYLEKSGGKASLEFSDLRKFAKIKLIKKSELNQDKELSRLGIEPLEKDFSVEYFWKLVQNKKTKNIKSLIMDQSFIVGIGNIYASEALFEARINPLRLAGSLSKKETGKLHSEIVNILKKAVKMRGTTDSDYRDIDGSAGEFQNVLKVYNKEGEKCFGCERIIERVKIGQRSTFWCKRCQR